MKKRLTALILTLVFVAAVLAGCAVAAAERNSDNQKANLATVTEAPATEAPAKETLLDADAAKVIALAHAGVAADAAKGLRAEYEVDDGVKEYEIEFRSGDYEYEYTVNAETGKIIHSSKEHDPIETKPAATEAPATEAPTEAPTEAAPPETEAKKEESNAKESTSSNKTTSSSKSSSEKIGKSKAKSIALKHAGLTAGKVTNLRCEYEVDDGVKEYEVEFRYGDYEYDYTIHAITGKIRAYDKEYDPVKSGTKETTAATEPKATEATSSSSSELIGKSKAKSIALKHAGLSSSDVTGLRCEYEVDDGVKEYEVDFRCGDYEYDYTVNAKTGKILSHDKEYDPVETKPAATEPKETEAPAEEKIGASKAKSIALKHAGFSADEVKEMECEYDVDDGVKKYEVSFRKGNYEYDYDINAITGKIISWDKEYDD